MPTGSLPLSKIGERLMVHPTSVTNAIDRLEAQGLVKRLPDAADRRRTLAELTATGKDVLAAATKALMAIDFAIEGLSDQAAGEDVRAAAHPALIRWRLCLNRGRPRL